MNKKSKVQLDELIVTYKRNKEKIEKLQDDNDFIKKRIIFLMDKAKESSYKYYNPELFENELKATICERKTVSYDVQRAKELLGKKRFSEIVDKEYSICDISKLIELAKSHGVSPKELKSCLNINEKINNKKLDQAYNLGDIEEEEVQEFASVETSTRYLAIK